MYTLLADIVIPTTNLIGLLILILDILAIVSVVAGRGSLGHKLLWTLLILVLPVLGIALLVLLSAGIWRMWSSHKAKDPLADVPAGVYQPPKRSSGDVLPVPTQPRR